MNFDALWVAAAAAVLTLGSARDAVSGPLEDRRQVEACRFARANAPEISAGSLVEFGPLEPPAVQDAPKGAEKAVQEWARRGATNLFTACPDLKTALPSTVRAATADDYKAVAMLPAPRSIFITGFLAPFVSADGRYLIISQTYRCPGLCGGYFVNLYTRQGRGWSEPRVIAMAIS